MNIQTLLKLKNNPHYKMSAEQERQLADYEKPPMIRFGKPQTHNNKFVTHPNLKKGSDEKED
jgi:hypothetical protein